MGKYIDWYLVELEGLAATRMKPDRAYELVVETQNHLEDRASELRVAGMSDKDAELAAIERFGRAGKVVDFACPDSSLIHCLAPMLACASLAALALVLLYFVCGSSAPPDWEVEARFVGAAASALAASILLCRRVIWREIGAAAIVLVVLSFLGFGSAFAGPGLLRRAEIPARRVAFQRARTEVRMQIAELAARRIAYDSRDFTFTMSFIEASDKKLIATVSEPLVAPVSIADEDIVYGKLVPRVHYMNLDVANAARAWDQVPEYEARLRSASDQLLAAQLDLHRAERVTVWQSGLANWSRILESAFPIPILALIANFAVVEGLALIRRGRSLYRRRFA